VTTLTTLVKDARSAIEKQDDEAVKAATEKLEKEAHRIASVMYGNAAGGDAAAAGGAPSPGADGGPGPSAPSDVGKKGGVIDAEFEETS
jgi:molecular chaperone DnaK